MTMPEIFWLLLLFFALAVLGATMLLLDAFGGSLVTFGALVFAVALYPLL